MNDDILFLAVKPLSIKTTRAGSAEKVILRVMQHNHREIQAEFGTRADSKINPSRMNQNVILCGMNTAAGVVDNAREVMRNAGITAIRKNATLGIEIVISLPAATAIDCLAYFRDAMQWAQAHYNVPMVSAIVHQDEDCPHAHFVLIPAREGKLIGSELLGDRATTKALQVSFHEQVGKRYGLRLPTPKKRHSAATRRQAIDSALKLLEANSGLTGDVLRALLEPHTKNPEPLLMMLGLAMPAAKVKPGDTFAGIMTRPCKPETPNRTFGNSLIGDFHSQQSGTLEPEKQSPMSLLGHLFSAPSIGTPNDASQAAIATTSSKANETRQPTANTIKVPSNPVPELQDTDRSYTRERDNDTAADYWDGELGEFIKPPVKASSKRQIVEAVHMALNRLVIH